MVGRASLARELGSPAAFSLDSTTPRETRRSSSRASRKTTREPESHASNHSQSSYSLPPTPLTTTFEESLPSAKRRKTQRSVNQAAQTPKGKEPTETPISSTSKGPGGSSQPSDSVSKRRERSRKSAKLNGEVTPNAPPPSETPVPQSKSRPEQSQSTLHHFLLKKPQPKRHSLATTTSTSTPRVTSSDPSTPRALSTSASAPRVASTPVSTRKDPKSKGTETSKNRTARTPVLLKTEFTPAETAVKPTSAQDKGTTKPQTPAASSRPAAPRLSTSRARRTDRRTPATVTSSRLNPSTTEGVSTPTSSSNMGNSKSVPSRASQKGSVRPQRSSSRRSVVESRTDTPSQAPNQNIDNSNAGGELSSGPESLAPMPSGREFAESIYSTTPASDEKVRDLGTPIFEDNNTPGATPYADSFHFEYDTDMYRNNFGLDGTTETPGSPTGSLTTATSMGNRISTRLRKPTIKAMESIESERRYRRPPRSASARPDGPKGPPLEWDAVAIGIQVFDLANVALAPEFEPPAEADAWLDELRGEFAVKHAEREKARLERERLEKEREEKEREQREMEEKEAAERKAADEQNAEKEVADEADTEKEVLDKENEDGEATHKVDGEKEATETQNEAEENREKVNGDKEADTTTTPLEEQLPNEPKAKEPAREASKPASPDKQPSVEAKSGDKAEGPSKPTFSGDNSKEWTDEDGFTYTGQVNQFGEELVYVGTEYEWYRPNNTYGDELLPLPPVRLISRDQLEKDRIFGFPPLMGERNIPRETNMPFTFEDVMEERAKIKARDAARKRGIEVDRYMPSAAIQALIAEHDKTSSDQEKSGPGAETKGPAPRKRRRGAEQPTDAAQAAKRRRKGETPPFTPDQPKTLRIKLTLKGTAAAAAAEGTSSPNPGSKKRTRSEVESAPGVNGTPDSKAPQTRPTKLLKLSGLRRDSASTSTSTSTPAKSNASPATPGGGLKNNAAPTPPSTSGPQAFTATDPSATPLGTTPGGRPRRRAAAAFLAESQTHAEQRARRANARKKEPVA
ncbi:putative GPI-anchored cell surface glycoprotein [Aspergillus homomorphus CBS 101889]|uniref:GPI-anchored cell surface glycoprotein n=1 Tax=Aspergillus homomorphus (strain CBS 101889) TaxID=1450537 RepID=A0A395IAA2_ASPHC|nr:hypothetical protein BO97DRAFT_178968 [Aspergillus homomorphus CBS 101889]RAL15998.1 hypothetical protein BO97DRAFT_178968 [Aspergillus homomorphus CBS 101889]